MSLTTKRTIYGNALQTAMFNNAQHEVQENSTLNEKFNVLVAEELESNPTLGYYCIGRGGHKNYSGGDGAPLIKSQPHRARDAAMFTQLPFVMREMDDDLDAPTRNNYAIRTIENFGGVDYYCYYLKRTVMENQPIRVEHSVTADGNTETVPFTPTPSDLSPKPVEIPSEGVTPGSGETLSVSSTFEIDFDATDAQNLMQVCRIRYNDETYATVSEIGICSGEDFALPTQGQDGSSFILNEAIAVQIAMFVSCMYPMQFSNQGFNIKVDLGASEPLAVDNGGATGATPTAASVQGG